MAVRSVSNAVVLVRRAAVWLSTVGVALIVALAMPVSQLRTISVVKTCCCPDPSNCHCPDHDGDTSSQPSMRACHNSEQAFVAPAFPAFDAAVVAVAAAPALPAIAVAHSLLAPHPAPPPTRPDAPS
jgi:hypothetical protein